VFASVVAWIEKYLKVPVNRDKSDTGHPWDRQFLGYQPTEEGTLRPAPKSLEKLRAEVRRRFSGSRSQTTQELCHSWEQYIRGWWNYYHLADERFWRKTISPWIRRHMRKCFWLRWHKAKGRRRRLLRLGVPSEAIRINLWGRAWRSAKHPVIQRALKNKTLSDHGLKTPSDYAPC
jgi:hypothetical protein